MMMSNQISPGITIRLEGRIYRVEASVKVTVAKANPFIKTKLRDLVSDKVIEKNFKLNQPVEEVALIEHQLEYLYPEGKNHIPKFSTNPRIADPAIAPGILPIPPITAPVNPLMIKVEPIVGSRFCSIPIKTPAIPATSEAIIKTIA